MLNDEQIKTLVAAAGKMTVALACGCGFVFEKRPVTEVDGTVDIDLDVIEADMCARHLAMPSIKSLDALAPLDDRVQMVCYEIANAAVAPRPGSAEAGSLHR